MLKTIQNLSKPTIIGLFIIGASLCSLDAHAQFGKKLKEKMKKVGENLEKKLEEASTISDIPSPDVSQSVTAAKFESGKYKYWRSNGSSSAGAPNGTYELEIIKKDGKVVEVKMNGKQYLPDQYGKSDFVRYWEGQKGNHLDLFFTETRVFLLNVYTNGNVSWKGILKKQAPYKYIPAIEEYQKAAMKNQTADIEAYNKKQKEAEEAAAAERKRKFSIEGKDVVSISLANFKKSDELSNFDASWSYDIEAKLKDGTVISTAKGGFLSDYKVVDENVPVYKPHHNITFPYGMQIKTGFVKGDKIVIKVASKYNPAIKVQKEIVLNYKHKKGRVYISRSANQWGYSAEDVELKIKKVKHAITGEDLYQYRLTSLSMNAVVVEGKIRTDQRMLITSNGYQGKPYNQYVQQTSRGGNGGDGGNIIIIKDPNISSLDGFLQTENNGGRAGRGSASYLDGRAGRDGTIKTVTKPVTF